MLRADQRVIYPPKRRKQPQTRNRFRRYWWLLGGVATVVGGLIAINFVTIRGVPGSIVLQFMLDDQARHAYLTGNKYALHDRLNQLGVEEQIKAYYRPKIRDEEKLDQYIHQVFYEMTGYVGNAYFVNSQGTLVLKSYVDPEFERWFKLAKKAGVVVGRQRKNGMQYVVSSQGTVASYAEVAAIFPISELEKLIEMQRSAP
jgi:hypothetical protein